MYSNFTIYWIKGTVFAALLFSIKTHASSYEITEDLPFTEADPSLTLDLYLPKSDDEPHPCVLVIQGGGFAPQTGQKFKPFAEYIAERGFAAALVSYRGRPNHNYLDTISDNKAAVRFVRANSAKYGIDPERIGAMGRSAGGTLAAMLAVTGDDPEFEGTGGHHEYSSNIQAAVAYAGVFDFVSRFADEEQIALQPNVKTKIQSNGEWIGPPFSASQGHWINASAINHVDKNDPPILLIQCKDDATVPWIQTKIMHKALMHAEAKSSVIYYETGGHGFRNLGEKPMEEMARFFDKQLRR